MMRRTLACLCLGLALGALLGAAGCQGADTTQGIPSASSTAAGGSQNEASESARDAAVELLKAAWADDLAAVQGMAPAGSKAAGLAKAVREATGEDPKNRAVEVSASEADSATVVLATGASTDRPTVSMTRRPADPGRSNVSSTGSAGRSRSSRPRPW